MFGKLRPAGLGCPGQAYQASFCGSCHAMAKVNRVASLSTSYDLTFLHYVLASLGGAPTHTLPCTALPYRDVKVRVLEPPSQRWLAAINLLLLAAKCEDDVLDEGGWKGRLGLSLLSSRLGWARDVMQESGFPSEAVTELPQRQAAVEASDSPSLEALAMPTSLMLGEVFAHAAHLSGNPQARVPLRHLGQGLGMAIYIKDAQEDLDGDRRRGRFNAILASGLDGDHNRYVANALSRELKRAQSALRTLGLGGETAPLPRILGGLESSRPAPARAHPVAALRRRKARAGDCVPCFCDCGGCDCSVCDCGNLGCCENCASCDCGSCGSTSSSGETAVAGASKLEPRESLLCPGCGDRMHANVYSAVEIDECHACHGLWFDHQELEQLSALKAVPPRLLTSKELIVRLQRRPEGTRPCPRCAKNLTTTPLKGIKVDICSDCKGIFLDQGELNVLLDSADQPSS